MKQLLPIIVSLLFVAIAITALCQRDNALRRYAHAEHTIQQNVLVIDSLETMCQFQAADIEYWQKEAKSVAVDIDLQNEVVRMLKARAEALEGRIQKMAGAFHIREQNLYAEIDRLRKELRGCVPEHPQDPPYTPPNQEPIEPAPPVPGCR
jgi:hypothetical protein